MRFVRYVIQIYQVSLILVAMSFACFAQETVFNVPSGDILDRGKFYGELDVTYRPSNSLKSFTPRIVAGIGHNIEVGLNINGIVAPGMSETAMTPTVKWKACSGGNNGWAFFVGDNLFFPVQNRIYDNRIHDVGTWTYAEFTKSWQSKTRLTFGGYYASRNVFSSGQRGGGQFAVEQGVGQRLTLAADWFTGNDSVGYVTPGLIFKLTHKLTGYLSYQIGNSEVSQGNHQVLGEIGWNFN
jgi:hypothetical protein